MNCPACKTEACDVRVAERKLPPVHYPAGQWIATVCMRCGKWLGYRPVDTRKPNRQEAELLK